MKFRLHDHFAAVPRNVGQRSFRYAAAEENRNQYTITVDRQDHENQALPGL
jgi:hypothetical protein